MNQVLRTAFLGSLLVGLAANAAGCIVGDCDDNDPNTTCAETGVFFVGSEVSKTTSYSAGQNIRIKTDNGNVSTDTNAIIVKRGGNGDEVVAVFKPVTYRAGDQEDEASREMKDSLDLIATSDGDVVIEAKRKADASDGLGCGIEVTLPDGFDGAITIEQDNATIDADLTGGLPSATTVRGDNGDVAIAGAAGKLDITNSNGDTTVSVQAWATADGSVSVDRDLLFFAPPDANGEIDASTGDSGLVAVDSLPSDWTETVTDEAHKSYVLGDGSGATVTLTSDFEFAEIHIGEQS